jgi:hypothetical protein
MRALRDSTQFAFRFLGRCGITGDTAQVHQIDHGCGRAVLRDDVQHGGRRSQTLSSPAECNRHRQPKQSSFRQGGDRLFGKRRFAIDPRRLRTDVRDSNRGGFRHGALLFLVEVVLAISNHAMKINSVVKCVAAPSKAIRGNLSRTVSNSSPTARWFAHAANTLM